MLRMNRTLLQILLKIPYDQVEATKNLSGLISTSSKYTVKYGTAFQCPTRPKPYSPTIAVTMSDPERCKAEATYLAHKEDYLLYEAAEMEIMRFITTNVDETWYQGLENAEKFYTEVTFFEMIEHLQKHSGGQNTIDAVDIMYNMYHYFGEVARITVCINMM